MKNNIEQKEVDGIIRIKHLPELICVGTLIGIALVSYGLEYLMKKIGNIIIFDTKQRRRKK